MPYSGCLRLAAPTLKEVRRTIAAKPSTEIIMRLAGPQKVVRSLTATEMALFFVFLVSIGSWKNVWKVHLQGALSRSSKSMANLTDTNLMFEGRRKTRATWVVAFPVGRRS